ncbi:hypothetical protein ABIB15_002137 [Marisediminicola sp. UYEF4]|uniref:hypothetical protein n=1 Tax=Marisediminicola sp. UYEF4 TaxID=1756384 RepID=UPI0033925CCC
MSKPPPHPVVAEATDAATRLRAAAGGQPLPLAVATYLDAIAKHWRDWLPSDPAAVDRATVAIIRAVLATYPGTSPATQTPEADAGTRQHSTPEKKG